MAKDELIPDIDTTINCMVAFFTGILLGGIIKRHVYNCPYGLSDAIKKKNKNIS